MVSDVQLPYELLAEIFKFYTSFPDTLLPETLLHVCRTWSVVASNDPTLWTKFVILSTMVKSDDREDHHATLTRDWVGIFKRRLARAGPSLPLQIFIFGLHELLISVIDVVSGGMPDYVHLPRWETLHFEAPQLTRPKCYWGSIATLMLQHTLSLKCLTLQQSSIDFHAFPKAPMLEELNILSCRAPFVGRVHSSFPNLKKLHITYPSKYPLCNISLTNFSLQFIETLIIGGYVDVGSRLNGTYPVLSRLEFTDRVPPGIVQMSAPSLRHLILRNAELFCMNISSLDSEFADPLQKNKDVMEMLVGTFSTVEVLEVHENLRDLALEIVSRDKVFFPGLKELWTVSQDDRRRIDLVH